ncbi:uncharacterized protein AMSG_10694 [Thecamonas trahens ATCC 50062]|uniref:L-type lectin-like domain-containing protein n=1 Tax=Thecamonas trahens ATCC 50062 TaxID=461836 RepID=A0A0L0DSV9_THETB|nr:hypothetical protein AMSG_10694 [Thecamonas trahens ATCC 50062]KNC55096.1 hypothetical protein AMSG_10694 [Thecamonas trahens ATCC 50062]|eukprot:XP_013753280.1 hypothetical protein AMSG_10694 [Thecamonas trahens ATCC 50062]
MLLAALVATAVFAPTASAAASFFGFHAPFYGGSHAVELISGPSQSTRITAQNALMWESFEMALEMTVTKDHEAQRSEGYEGTALWLTRSPLPAQAPPSAGGTVYGAPRVWDGLGVFFDVFDTDGDGAAAVITSMLSPSSLWGSSRNLGEFDPWSDGRRTSHGHCPVRLVSHQPVPASAPGTAKVLVHIKYTSKAKRVDISISDVGQPNSAFAPCASFDANLDGARHLALTAASSHSAFARTNLLAFEVYDLEHGLTHPPADATRDSRFPGLQAKVEAAVRGEIDEHPLVTEDIPPAAASAHHAAAEAVARDAHKRAFAARDSAAAAADTAAAIAVLDGKLSDIAARLASAPAGSASGSGADASSASIRGVLNTLSDSVTELVHAHQADEIVRHFERVESESRLALDRIAALDSKLSTITTTLTAIQHAGPAAGPAADGYSLASLVFAALIGAVAAYAAASLFKSPKASGYKLP